jgi:hypothetical protein
MNRLFSLIFIFIFCITKAQVGPRGWQDHLSFNYSNSVTKCGSTVYASNGAAMIIFNEKELSPKLLSKINGLSDVGIRMLRANPYNMKTLVIYENCNIDVVDVNGNISNYPSFQLKSFVGKKIINEVTFDKNLAYLACGFGIVVFDTDKMEVKDTYIIGPGATNLEILQVAVNDSLIFAATPIGIFQSNFKTRILNNYKNWTYDTVTLPKGYYPGIVNVKGTILTAQSLSINDATKKGQDTFYSVSDQNQWQIHPPLSSGGHTVYRFGGVYEDLFSTIDDYSVVVRRVATGKTEAHLNSVNGVNDYGTLRDVYVGKDFTGNFSYWVSDARFGLYQTYGTYPYQRQNQITRNGTNHYNIGNIDVNEGRVAVSPSLIDNAGKGNYLVEGVNILNAGEWKYIQTTEADLQTRLMDVTSVLLDRKDKNSFWACSWGYGVVKYTDDKLVSVFTPSNTTMPQLPSSKEPRCSGMSMDKNGNLWVAHSDQKGFLGVIKTDGSYQNFQFEAGRFSRKTFVDRNSYVWILHERDGGITVFKPEFKNNVFSSPTPSVNYKVLDNSPGTGNLQSKSIFAIAEDQDGRIWVGTTAGISVIYNSTAIFGGGDYDSQPIKIVQDGNVELLLDKETVTSIVVDGANNKWCGTMLGGVYCFSPDGVTQLYHFTKENSPLYSNTIIDLNYDEITGDVFIGTDIGVQSFRGIIVAGEKQYSNVYAYPNPVKPNYQGTVLVRGLIDESVVKIADESGNLVWETKSTGGQIEWPVKTLSGNRVTSGVYIVYAATTNGEFKALTKVLVVN